MEEPDVTAAGSLYEDKFEQELEKSRSDEFHDDQLEDILNLQDEIFDRDDEIYRERALLDHNVYPDCDDDLEKVLSNGNRNLHSEESRQRENILFTRILNLFRNRNKAGIDNFYDAAEEVGYDSTTPDSGVHENLQNMDPEQRAKLEEEWHNELAKTEESIQTLRQVLASQVKHAQELKRKLGITVWKEFRDDVEQGLKNVKESTAYQKTNTALKSASEKTSTALGSFGTSVSKKLGDVKNSTAFRSFEEKVGSVYTNVRTKMTGSRSSSMQNFEEVLEDAEGRRMEIGTPATTPTIPEEKSL